MPQRASTVAAAPARQSSRQRGASTHRLRNHRPRCDRTCSVTKQIRANPAVDRARRVLRTFAHRAATRIGTPRAGPTSVARSVERARKDFRSVRTASSSGPMTRCVGPDRARRRHPKALELRRVIGDDTASAWRKPMSSPVRRNAATAAGFCIMSAADRERPCWRTQTTVCPRCSRRCGHSEDATERARARSTRGKAECRADDRTSTRAAAHCALRPRRMRPYRCRRPAARRSWLAPGKSRMLAKSRLPKVPR